MKHNFIEVEGAGTGIKSSKVATPCIYCGIVAWKHKKCSQCRILIHTEKHNCECGKAHTYSEDGIDCASCQEIKVKGKPAYLFDGVHKLLGL